MFFIMPETEQRSLEDIELHFSDNSKGMTDIQIAKYVSTNAKDETSTHTMSHHSIAS